MTSAQVLFGMFWLPVLMVVAIAGYCYWQHRKYTPNNSSFPDIDDVNPQTAISDRLNDKIKDNRTGV